MTANSGTMTGKSSPKSNTEEIEALAAIETLVESAPVETQPINAKAFVVTDEDVARMEALIRQNQA
ncbi:MAG: hypothetical protein OEW39_09860 [Deltaproteobacteria bacterium]|nr:hypothetical protein [Deltaproteobacteria bacterium]